LVGVQKGVWAEEPPACHVVSQGRARFQFNIQLSGGGASLGHAPVCRLVSAFQAPNTTKLVQPLDGTTKCYEQDLAKGDRYRGGGLELQQALGVVLGLLNIVVPLALAHGSRHGLRPRGNWTTVQLVCIGGSTCNCCLGVAVLLGCLALVGLFNLVPCARRLELMTLLVVILFLVVVQMRLLLMASCSAQRTHLSMLSDVELPENDVARFPARVVGATAIDHELRALQLEAGRLLLEALPMYKWGSSGFEDDGSQDDCPLCMDIFAQDQEVRKMPCSHFFHTDCIERWFLAGQQQSFSCPLCRMDILRACLDDNRHQAASGTDAVRGGASDTDGVVGTIEV